MMITDAAKKKVKIFLESKLVVRLAKRLIIPLDCINPDLNSK